MEPGAVYADLSERRGHRDGTKNNLNKQTHTAMRPDSRPVDGVAVAGAAGSTHNLSPSAVNQVLMEFVMYAGRAFVVFYPVYLTGYLGLSVSWVLLCMMMVTWWRKNRRWKDVRIGAAIDFVDNEKHAINRELKASLSMATWVRGAATLQVDRGGGLPIPPRNTFSRLYISIF